MGPETLVSFTNVFHRYVAQHGAVTLAPHSLIDASGTQIGALESVQIRQGHWEISGWAEARSITLKSDAYEATVSPSAPRRTPKDTAEPGAESFTGFEIAIPDTDAPATLQVQSAQGEISLDLLPPPAALRRRVHLKTALRFAKVAAQCAPDAFVFLRSRNDNAKARIKARLGFETPVVFNKITPRIFDTAPLSVPPTALPKPEPVTIIMPVYNAFDLLGEVTDRVLRHSPESAHLVIVEDASPDPQVRPFLQNLRDANPQRITLLENAENLGFVGSMNRGFAQAQSRTGPVIALNSDAFVPEDWLPRLLAPMRADPTVATVTPFANDAEIANVPIICVPLSLSPGQADAIDAVAGTLSPQATVHDAPTGVGFCMAMNRRYLELCPEFDPIFGRGYGEEVDWCQQVRAQGGRHVLTAGLFVEHRGGQSFGSAEKRERIAQNNAIVARRYPNYNADVRDFLDTDPLCSARLALALAYAGSIDTASIEIHLAHSLGGGAEDALQKRLREATDAGRAAVVLRVGGMTLWQIDVYTPAGLISGACDDLDLVRKLLAPIQHRHIVYSCGVGSPDPLEIPALLVELAGETGTLEVLFHDFFPLSPSYCLLNADGTFTGLPDPTTADRAHRFQRDALDVPLRAWRNGWEPLMARANALVVFSTSSQNLVGAAYPAHRAKILVQPHTPHTQVPQLTASPSASGHVIGVLGNIGFQKGAALLSDMSRTLGTQKSDTRIVVIGNFDLNYRIRDALTVHGAYQLSDLERLVQHYGIECWLIPSIWPETYSYVTREALMTGLPVFCGNLGAQADAVRNAEHGHVLRNEPLQADATLAEIQDAMGWSR